MGERCVLVTNPARGASRRLAAHPRPAASANPPKRHTTLYATLVFALLLSGAALGIGATVDSPRTLMSPVDYSAGKKGIEAQTRLAFARCRTFAATAKDVCKAEVRAEERIRKADLDARYHGTVAAQGDARLARARAVYDVAKARCGSRMSDQRVECLRAAREDRIKALADLKLAAST